MNATRQAQKRDPVVEEYSHIAAYYETRWSFYVEATTRESECLSLLKQVGHPKARVERYKINWLWGLMTATATKNAP